MKKHLFLTLLIFILSSCGFIHYMGTKENLPKSKEEINLYLKKHKIPYDYSFFFPYQNMDSLSKNNHQIDLYKKKTGASPSPMQARIYNPRGKLINGYTQCYGPIKWLNIFAEKDFKYFEKLPNNYDLDFKDEFDLIHIPSQEKQKIIKESTDKEYTFVIYWNIYSNFYSKSIFRKLKKYLKKYNMRDQTLIILLNTDKHKNHTQKH